MKIQTQFDRSNLAGCMVVTGLAGLIIEVVTISIIEWFHTGFARTHLDLLIVLFFAGIIIATIGILIAAPNTSSDDKFLRKYDPSWNQKRLEEIRAINHIPAQCWTPSDLRWMEQQGFSLPKEGE